MKFTAVLYIVFCFLTGCAGMPDYVKPEAVDVGWGHNSYPALGYPFGPADEEDTLDTLGLRSQWRKDRYFLEAGVGYKLRDGGFYGRSDWVFTSRVGVDIWRRK